MRPLWEPNVEELGYSDAVQYEDHEKDGGDGVVLGNVACNMIWVGPLGTTT